jgi:hypothetical protein
MRRRRRCGRRRRRPTGLRPSGSDNRSDKLTDSAARGAPWSARCSITEEESRASSLPVAPPTPDFCVARAVASLCRRDEPGCARRRCRGLGARQRPAQRLHGLAGAVLAGGRGDAQARRQLRSAGARRSDPSSIGWRLGRSNWRERTPQLRLMAHSSSERPGPEPAHLRPPPRGRSMAQLAATPSHGKR